MVMDPTIAVEQAAEAVRQLLDRPGLRQAIRLAEQLAAEAAATQPRAAVSTAARGEQDNGQGGDAWTTC
jgi:hypothetical protein